MHGNRFCRLQLVLPLTRVFWVHVSHPLLDPPCGGDQPVWCFSTSAKQVGHQSTLNVPPTGQPASSKRVTTFGTRSQLDSGGLTLSVDFHTASNCLRTSINITRQRAAVPKEANISNSVPSPLSQSFSFPRFLSSQVHNFEPTRHLPDSSSIF